MPAGFVTPSKGRVVALTLIAWLSMLGVDFLLHAGLLADLYRHPSPFLVSPATAFALIPVGYLSFLLLAVLLVWLLLRLRLAGWRAGALFGLEVGGLTWGAFVLGLLSISTASPRCSWAGFWGRQRSWRSLARSWGVGWQAGVCGGCFGSSSVLSCCASWRRSSCNRSA